MKKHHILLILSLFLLVGNACKKNHQINPDSNLKLEFSADTVIFDTVFTSLGSATHQLMIYNNHSDDLKISSIRLIGGENSPYRLNLDGESATEFYDKIIPAEDSLFSFLRVTINPNDLNTPFVVEDELEFITNGNTQTVKLLGPKCQLHSSGQAGHFGRRALSLPHRGRQPANHSLDQGKTLRHLRLGAHQLLRHLED